MLDVVMIGIFVVLVASMVNLASWSDKVVKEGKQS
ncbi:signal peptide protein [Bacillus thuringiensis]